LFRVQMAVPELNQHQSLETRITKLAEQTAVSMGIEIVLVVIKGGGNRSIIRMYIDRPGGITLDDCERFSKRFSVLLDVEDWIPFSYVLEVSSPGLDRPLVKVSDFQRFCGHSARVRTRLPVKGQRNFKGKIASVTQDELTMELAPDKQVVIAFKDIEEANLVAVI
jgi:ribosome maturation factor RimP